ncbi:MAG: hypothetical protein ACFB0B_09025 [Thermonemataceae bacterium]
MRDSLHCVSVPLEDTQVRGGLSGDFWIFDLKVADLKELEGKSYYVKDGYNNERYSDCSTFYYYEHQPISENTIEFVKYQEDVFLVKVIASTCDVNHYDGSKPETKIELMGEFKI